MEMTFLPPVPLLTAFVIASLVLALVPGPGVLYIVARSLGQGRRSGLTSVAGVALGNLGNAIGASIGLTALLNPKTAVFFAAFLPQFMDPGRPAIPQGIVLGTLFAAIAASTDTAYALAASAVAPALARGGRLRNPGRYLAGGTFIGLGVLATCGGSRGNG